jgi:hypothetical protein
MPAPKFTVKGKTVRRVRASVSLHPDLHRAAAKRADQADLTLSDWIASLVGKACAWRRPKEGVV